MRLMHGSGGIELPLEEDAITVLCVENHQVLAEMLYDLWNQSEGSDGEWILSEGERELNISREIECIFNPFAVDPNKTTILSKVYKELSAEAQERLPVETAHLNREILQYIDHLLDEHPYPMEPALEMDIVTLLKAYDVRFPFDSATFIDRLLDYVKIVSRVLGRSIIAFLNLQQFVPEHQIEELYRNLKYEKVLVLLIEGNDNLGHSGERKYIIDRDMCVIEVASDTNRLED